MPDTWGGRAQETYFSMWYDEGTLWSIRGRNRQATRYNHCTTHSMHQPSRENHGSKGDAVSPRHNLTLAVRQYAFLAKYARKKNKSDKNSRMVFFGGNHLAKRMHTCIHPYTYACIHSITCIQVYNTHISYDIYCTHLNHLSFQRCTTALGVPANYFSRVL